MIAVLVGGLSGGLMSGILTGIPGTPSSVATTFDGFPMARRGEPEPRPWHWCLVIILWAIYPQYC